MGQRHSKSHNRHAEGSLTKYRKLKSRISRHPATLTGRRNTKEYLRPPETKAHCAVMATATHKSHATSSLTSLPVPILTRTLHFLDPVSQECFRRACQTFYHLPDPNAIDPFADPEDPFADSATAVNMDMGMDMEPHGENHIGGESQTQAQDSITASERETLCPSCIDIRTSPTYPERLKKATKLLHCARCKADHPRCLFSRLQRDATKIPQSIRYCIGHEGVLRPCEHKAVSWLQIINMSREILKQKVGRRWKVIRCRHEDHLSSGSDENSSRPGVERGRSFEKFVDNMRGKGCPTLTVGYKDSSKDFCLVLKWKGHVTLDISSGVVEEELREKLKELRVTHGRYICPEPEPGLKVEEMVLAGLMLDRCEGLGPDGGKERSNVGKGKILLNEPGNSKDMQEPVSLSKGDLKVETTTNIKSVRSSLSLTDIPPVPEEDTTDTDGSVEIPSNMKSLVIKHGKLAGCAKVTWGLGIDSGTEWVPVVTDPPTKVRDDIHDREKKQDEHLIHAHHHHEHEKSHRKAITDSFKIKPCRASKLKKCSIIRDICHENKDEVCLKVKYSRRVYIGDQLHGASVRNFVGFQNWISVLDPASYKLTEDEEGFGVYWCGGTLDGGNGTDGLDHEKREMAGKSLDTHPAGKDLHSDKAKCRNYYRYIKSRTEGLQLTAGDYTRSCKKGSDERHPIKC